MSFSLPTNIKQIGSIGAGLRIYVEDYVCTFLTRHAEEGGYDERLAWLVGRYMLIDSMPVLFISGAVEGKYTEERDGQLHFTDKARDFAEKTVDENFPGMEIVGWMQSQPGYGTFLNQQYATSHFREFPKFNQVMFVTDPLEGVNTFYIYNDDRSALLESKGYFIYYDKNTAMQEYMLSLKDDDYVASPINFVEESKDSDYESAEEEVIKIPRADSVRADDPRETMRRRQEHRSFQKRSMREQKRTINLLVSMSAVLFVVSFIMGAGLMQSQSRLESMETQVFQLNTAYRNLYMQLSSQDAAAVFAPNGAEPAQQPPTAPESAPSAPAAPDSVTSEPAAPGVPAQPAQPDQPAESPEQLTINGIPVHPPINAPAAPTPHPQQEAPPAAEAAPPEQAAPAVPAAPAAPPPIEQPPAAPPAPPVRPPSAAHIPESYVIQPGDSLIGISIQFYGTADRVEDILLLNGLADANMIIAGDTILLP